MTDFSEIEEIANDMISCICNKDKQTKIRKEMEAFLEGLK